jgi:hypothetical protein
LLDKKGVVGSACRMNFLSPIARVLLCIKTEEGWLIAARKNVVLMT